jgi:Hsp70 protein
MWRCPNPRDLSSCRSRYNSKRKAGSRSPSCDAVFQKTFPLFTAVSEERISQLVSQAASTNAEDQETAKRIGLRLRAEAVLVKADTAVRERRTAGIAAQADELVEEAIAELGIALAGEDTTKIEPLTSVLEKRLQDADPFDIFSDLFGSLNRVHAR